MESSCLAPEDGHLWLILKLKQTNSLKRWENHSQIYS
jgi:hypothetical protein